MSVGGSLGGSVGEATPSGINNNINTTIIYKMKEKEEKVEYEQLPGSAGIEPERDLNNNVFGVGIFCLTIS
jgi:hypothetical protein